MTKPICSPASATYWASVPKIVALGFDAEGRLWAVEAAAGGVYSLARIGVG